MTVKEFFNLNRNNKYFLLSKESLKEDKLSEIYLELYLEDSNHNKIYILTFGNIEELYGEDNKTYEELWEREIKSFYMETDTFDSSVVKMRIQI